MSVAVHIHWEGDTHLVGLLRPAARGTTVTFEYHPEWLKRSKPFAIDPTSLPLGAGPKHSPMLFGAIQDCGPDRWGRVLIERAVRRHVLDAKPYRDLDYVLALEDSTRIGALRFKVEQDGPFLAASSGRVPPVVQLAALLNATDAVHGETETAQDLRFLLGAGSPLGGARPNIRSQSGSGDRPKPNPEDSRHRASGGTLCRRRPRRRTSVRSPTLGSPGNPSQSPRRGSAMAPDRPTPPSVGRYNLRLCQRV